MLQTIIFTLALLLSFVQIIDIILVVVNTIHSNIEKQIQVAWGIAAILCWGLFYYLIN